MDRKELIEKLNTVINNLNDEGLTRMNYLVGDMHKVEKYNIKTSPERILEIEVEEAEREAVRKEAKEKDAFKPFREFLEKVGSHTELYNQNDLKVLVLNPNISDDKKVTCVVCENLKNVRSVKVQEE